MKYIFATILLTGLACSGADAGTAAPGSINTILTMGDTSSVLFNQTGSRSNIPSCASGNPNRWAIPAGTAVGQAQVAVLLTAYAQGKQIAITGTGNCYRHPDTESVNSIKIID